MKKETLLFAVIIAITGCATDRTRTASNGVAPLPYYVVQGTGAEQTMHTTQELCELYRRYGFVEPGSQSCGDDWISRTLNETELSSSEAKSRRDDLQGTILGQATSACAYFLNNMSTGSGRWLNVVQALALFFSAGATAVSDNQDVKSLTAAAAALTGMSQLLEPSNERSRGQIKAEIELAQQRIERHIHLARQGDLAQYPLSVAVDDALKYHAACAVN